MNPRDFKVADLSLAEFGRKTPGITRINVKPQAG